MAILTALIEQLAEELCQRKLRLVTAESCTGGWIAQRATSLSGSSDWFECGYVTYSNTAKTRMLGVDNATLSDNGAVSEQVVTQMAEGALERSGADIAVAVSGVAGPTGGSEDKPVGTVWLAWATPNKIECKCFYFRGDRESVRFQSVQVAFKGLLEIL